MVVLRESPWYQEILQEGERKGKQAGRQEGELALILRLLPRRVGVLTPELQAKIQVLSLTQLEALGDSLLDFTELADLVAWLEDHQ